MATDTTIAFKNLPGFGWVDGFMSLPAISRLPLLSILTIVTVVGPFLVGAGFTESAGLFVSLFMTGCFVAVFVILARGIQSDLHSNGDGELAQQLMPTISEGRGRTILGLVIGLVSLCWFNEQFDEGALSWLRLLTIEYYGHVPVGQAVNYWLLCLSILLGTVVMVNLVFFFRSQLQVCRRWSQGAVIDLMHVEQCEVFSQQLIRYLLIVVILASLSILAHEILVEIGQAEAAMQFLGPLMPFALLGLFPILIPLVEVRDRIAEAKETEIEAIREALAGDREALARTQIAHVAEEFKAPDLMFYERQIRSIWEWPIQGDVQRIIFYVLLPPLAWILAALVEQIVESMM